MSNYDPQMDQYMTHDDHEVDDVLPILTEDNDAAIKWLMDKSLINSRRLCNRCNQMTVLMKF